MLMNHIRQTVHGRKMCVSIEKLFSLVMGFIILRQPQADYEHEVDRICAIPSTHERDKIGKNFTRPLIVFKILE